MSKITKKDIKELRGNCEKNIRYLVRRIGSIEGEIEGFNKAIELLKKLEEK